MQPKIIIFLMGTTVDLWSGGHALCISIHNFKQKKPPLKGRGGGKIL